MSTLGCQIWQFLGDFRPLVLPQASPLGIWKDKAVLRGHSQEKERGKCFNATHISGSAWGWAWGKETQTLPLCFRDRPLLGVGLEGKSLCRATGETLYCCLPLFSHINSDIQLNSTIFLSPPPELWIQEHGRKSYLPFKVSTAQFTEMQPCSQCKQCRYQYFYADAMEFCWSHTVKVWFGMFCQSTWGGEGKKLPLADTTMLPEILILIRTGTRYPAVVCGSFLHF